MPKSKSRAKPKTNAPEPQPPGTVAPDRPVMGALIDPMGHRPEALTEHEYDALRAHLTISRSENHETLADLIQATITIFGFEPGVSDEKALAWVVGSYMGDHCDETDGLLIPRLGRTITVLENTGEYQTLESMLAVLRAGGWFADWLKLQCHTIAEASMAADRYPSPLAI